MPKPSITKASALLILLIEQYKIPGYTLTLLEVQKLAYFLQEMGEPLRLHYEKYKYGPYAENLNHVLIRLDGHFIRGYGDRNRFSELELTEDAAKTAQAFLDEKGDRESIDRLKQVQDFIRGFESPYGMELLSSVHWATIHGNVPLNQQKAIVTYIQEWNERKRSLFKENHILKTIEQCKTFI
ncbi:hypothetical protein [Aureibacillus halotolerans]|uniref:Antitoxin SocA-like Panacea domain-containing protein n=1 Tax=Aureibacillus halotolerans TaxID=1508390 RepID=A0A4R6TXZ4_9BACI|nr:hypothetical protein [Aureibacillus halotolerans]TDQ37672.1 hypothetical protein EV213_11232 [Aureibacillus halotolerans]